MKPFSFRLASVLRYRVFMEKKAMMALMQLNSERDRLQASIDRLSARHSELSQTCRKAGADGTEAYLIQSRRAYMDSLKDDIEMGVRELDRQDGRIREQEAVLREETTRKKALERLKDLKLEAHRQGNEKMEQDRLDEMVINRRGLVTPEGVL